MHCSDSGVKSTNCSVQGLSSVPWSWPPSWSRPGVPHQPNPTIVGPTSRLLIRFFNQESGIRFTPSKPTVFLVQIQTISWPDLVGSGWYLTLNVWMYFVAALNVCKTKTGTPCQPSSTCGTSPLATSAVSKDSSPATRTRKFPRATCITVRRFVSYWIVTKSCSLKWCFGAFVVKYILLHTYIENGQITWLSFIKYLFWSKHRHAFLHIKYSFVYQVIWSAYRVLKCWFNNCQIY